MKRILCIWLPDWPLARIVAARPDLQGSPLVLHEPHPRGGERVVMCSPAARQLGVLPGMTLAEATAMAMETGDEGQGTGDRRQEARDSANDDTFSRNAEGVRKKLSPAPLQTLPADPDADRQALVQLAQWGERFSPLVGLEDTDRPECLLLDITGLARLFGGEEALASRAAAELAKQGYPTRLAVADTMGAAWAVAHWGPGDSILPSGQTFAAIAHLPVAALRLADQTVDLLSQLGIEHIQQLAALPRKSLQSRLGPEVLERLDQATGQADEVIEAIHPPPEFSAEWLLESPTDHAEVVSMVLERLVDRLTVELSAQGRGATTLACRLDHEVGPPTRLEVGLYRPSTSTRHLLELIHLQLDGQSLGTPVSQIAVTITRNESLSDRQQELFLTERSRADESQLAALVDRLAGRLGRRAVLRPWLVPDAEPERAVRYEPLVGCRAGRPQRAPVFRPLERPLRVLRRPVAIQVVSLASEGPPKQFVHARLERVITRHWGPERIETGWWRKRGGVQRDYYRVETTTGARFWLFRRLQDGKWFLHGEFD